MFHHFFNACKKAISTQKNPKRTLENILNYCLLTKNPNHRVIKDTDIEYLSNSTAVVLDFYLLLSLILITMLNIYCRTPLTCIHKFHGNYSLFQGPEYNGYTFR